jgi:uncharacterized protein (TIGR03086 family)
VNLVGSLDHTFQHAQRVIAGVTPDQYEDVTPCTEWTVHDLLEHMIGVVAGFGAAAAGTSPSPFALGSEPAEQFAAAAKAALSAWRNDGVMERVIDAGPGPMPGHVVASINLFDTATHTWDLATATGQDSTLPDDVAVAALDASRSIISPEIRVGRFGPEIAPPASADPTAQLVAFLGRTP